MTKNSPPPWTPQQERFGSVVVRWMTRINVWLFRASGGRLGSSFRYGAPVCLVTTIGRRSGQPRTIALIYRAEGDDIVLVASKGGMSHHPMWYLNMEANPACEVQIGPETRKMHAKRATGDEKQALWPRLNALYPEYDDYQARTTRDIPVLILSPR